MSLFVFTYNKSVKTKSMNDNYDVHFKLKKCVN